jgi:hypothetical protein
VSERLCLFECDQCAHQEWRPESQEPWLCAVCGYMRWSVVAVQEGPGPAKPPQDDSSTGR